MGIREYNEARSIDYHDRLRQVAALTRAGKKRREIAEILRCSVSTVGRARRMAGIANPPPAPWTENDYMRCKRLLDAGCSYRDAARTVGRSTAQLHRKFPGMGMSRSDAAILATCAHQMNHYRRINAQLR